MEKDKMILEEHKVTKKQIILGLGLLLLYFSDIFWIKYVPSEMETIIDAIWYLLLIILAIAIYFDDLKRDFNALKKNFKEYLPFCLKYWGIIIGSNLICTMIVVALNGDAISENQSAINSIPLYLSIPAASIYAPIVEETLFRGVFRKLFKNKILFVIMSAIVFGAIHVLGEPSFVEAIIQSLPYVSMGAIFAYVYVKTNNIAASMTVHATHNSMLTLLQVLSKVLL